MPNAADHLLDTRAVAAAPDRIALLFHDERVSYADLLARVNRFANGLVALGLRRDDRVVLMVKDSPALVVALLGTMKAGGVAVPINLRASSTDLAWMLDDSAARLLVLDAEFVPTWQSASGVVRQVPAVSVFVNGASTAGIAPLDTIEGGRADTFTAPPTRDADMAFWLYTSGTTGTPKAAIHRHGDVTIAERVSRDLLDAGPGDRFFATSKLFFAYSLGNNLFPALRLGATSILLDGWPDSASVAAVIDRHRPTIVASVPTMYRNMLRDGIATPERFAGVRHCLSAGERLPVVLFNRWQAATARAIIDGIGTTETIYFFLSNRPSSLRAGSSGHAAPGADVEIRDAQGTVITEAGQPGVLWVRMKSVAAGYWQQPDRTAAAFTDGWFRTGDIFVRDADGFHFHEGRADDMLKISGQWVSPAEIEEQVLKLPEVADAAVVGASNVDGLVRLALFVVPHDRAMENDAVALRIHDALTATLSVYKCPREVRLIDEIPRTATGKAQRYKLRATIESELPGP